MKKKLVGNVTQEEQEEIRTLFERKSGLIELCKIVIPENELLYEKLVKDMGETSIKFQNWWDKMASKYKWESRDGYKWEIDFSDCNIYITKG